MCVFKYKEKQILEKMLLKNLKNYNFTIAIIKTKWQNLQL